MEVLVKQNRDKPYHAFHCTLKELSLSTSGYKMTADGNDYIYIVLMLQ